MSLDMPQEFFTYEPLQPRHIRILEIDSAPHPSDLPSCKCIHISLDDRSQRYDAISYAWGSTQNPHQILINGKLLSVTQSVHDMLNSKTFTRPGTRLWIDAICINQDDLIEKGLQVHFMGEVYSHAQRTLVWLGPASEDSDLAISFAETVFSALPEIETGDVEITLSYAKKHPYGSPEWASLSSLLCRSWFTRTWVVQEVALATRTDVVCGDATLSWDTLERIVSGLNSLGYISMLISEVKTGTFTTWGEPGIAQITALSLVRNRVRNGEPCPISWLMQKFLASQTTEANDKVYGVLGMATDVSDPVFMPEYTKSPRTLFRDVTKFLVTRDAELDILRSAGIVRDPGNVQTPSWSFSSDRRHIYQAQLGTYPITPAAKPEFSFSHEGDQLTLRGFIFEELCQLSLIHSVMDAEPLSADETADYWLWYSQAKEMFTSTGQDEEVFWRTLLANRIPKDKDAPIGAPAKIPDQAWSTYHQAFQAIIPKYLIYSVEEMRPITLSTEGQMAVKFRDQAMTTILSRRFCVLRGGAAGLVPREARAGDRVAAFLGAPVLFVVRALPEATDGSPKYQLIGECYVHDRMNGQVMEMGLESKDIVLV